MKENNENIKITKRNYEHLCKNTVYNHASKLQSRITKIYKENVKLGKKP